MERTRLRCSMLGSTGLEITRIGFGAWQFGPAGEEDDAIAAIQRALECGINWIDSASAFGSGRSEQVVGRALEGLGEHERPYVFIRRSVRDGSRDAILREVDRSLGRLRVEAIDLYQIQSPLPGGLERVWSTLAELKEHGLLRHVGASNVGIAQLRRLEQVAPVETLQTRYNLIDRDARDELLPFAERHGIGVVVHSPLASGLLAGCMTRERIAGLPQGDWRVHDERFQGRALARNLALVDRLSEVAERHGTTPGAVAVACTLRNRAVDGALVGFRHPDEVDPLLDAAGLELDARDLAILEGWG